MKPEKCTLLFNICKWFFLSILFFCALPACRPVIALGRNPKGEDLKRIEKLPNYKNGEFQNLVQPPPPLLTRKRKARWTGFLKYFFNKPDSLRPEQPLPFMVTDLRATSTEKPTIVWFGHSTFLLKTKTATILADPSFSGFAGPFKGLINAFDGSNEYSLDDLPPIDILLISHDHYDHLDYETVLKLKNKVKRVIVPIGVGSHFRYWGFDPAIITELQWHESLPYTESLRIISTPAHHRSNRTFAQRKTLWSSYVIEADGYKIYFSGDTGYSPHFSLIGEKYGPFDVALLECGQYNTRWSQSHLFPWQTARAARDLDARLTIPIHWAKFAESVHRWNDPVKKLVRSADSLKIAVHTPYIGQPYQIGQKVEKQEWWDWD